MGLVSQVDYEYIKKAVLKAPDKFIKNFIHGKEKEIIITFNKKMAKSFLVRLLYKKGYSEYEIAEALGLFPSIVRQKLKTSSTKNLLAGIYMLGIKNFMQIAEEYPFSVKITKNKVKRILAEELVKAGWGTQQISLILGISKRTVQRIKRRINEQEEQ